VLDSAAKKTKEGLNLAIVLLQLGELVQKRDRVWRGTLAKAIAEALSNGKKITEEMVKPFIDKLIDEGFVEKKRKENTKWIRTKPVPTLVLTTAGKTEVKRLKALKRVQS